MLAAILGNATIEKILFYLVVYGEGYPTGMARVFSIPVNGIQQQLQRMENGGVIVSQFKGKTRLYKFNPRYIFLTELIKMLEKALTFIPVSEKEKYYRLRTRPRRNKKPCTNPLINMT